ncbi:hypothetical protein VU06_02835 [Desulfobulbus sp. F3]|nr:hypothetical protein [Desulfobulbus sp. F3]
MAQVHPAPFLFGGTMKKPQLMGILNVKPDSFSDGSSFFNAQSIDIGGESTRFQRKRTA